ncbi:hypothetical protein VTN77DRAFT_2954 [Rasamsonia byssochlamydoides]|uniref:uncharacterized protein n=1 Tax=Rasamsonia byssochlamydoides TaxID=89139 RepID=UPI0037448717
MPITGPRITPDSFFTTTTPSTISPPDESSPVTIYFITGNPGLIGYYHTFLSLLSSYLSSSPSSQESVPDSFHIYGHSLGGFEVGTESESESESSNENDDGNKKIRERQGKEPKLYGLEQQIHLVESRLEAFMSANTSGLRSSTQSGLHRPRAILMGHSVGAYIAMEILRRHREEFSSRAGFDIIGGVLLFPTVMDTASSPAGKKLTRLLYFIPQLALVASLLAKFLTFLFPDVVLRSLIRPVIGFPPEDAVETTLAFLKSKRGVRQALHMAADEMRDITTDKWSDDIWGTQTASSSSPSSNGSSSSSTGKKLSKLIFYFGRNDHWVAERTRDEIIAMRSSISSGNNKNTSGPKMVVCEEGLPHAFCIRHNDIMARKVAGFIREILAEQ